MENLFFPDSQSVPAGDSCGGNSALLMVVQLGIVHPPVPFYVNVEIDQAGLIPQWYTEWMQLLG